MIGPLWVWVFVDLPLALLAAGLWAYTLTLPDPLPLDEEERRYRRIPRPITRHELVMPEHALAATATSAYGPVVWR